MVFSSALFLTFFFPIVFFLYYLASNKHRNAILIFASLFFYAWGAPKFIYVLLPLTAIDFLLVNAMYKTTAGTRKKILLAGSIFINLGILAYFKYCNFFIENVNHILEYFGAKHLEWTQVALPIGISFFCFETLTYSIDAYRGVIKPLEKLTDYYLYIFFFPKLIAGPIVKFNLIEKQIPADGRVTDHLNIVEGFGRFCIGLAKKVLIANTMAEFADSYLNGGIESLNQLNSTSAWLAIISYTMQIYFDFSGYSDMALGMARMFGFNLPENFNNPYTAKSITEFWRKWHMTLGAWMKEYLYIPLGGNKVSKYKMYLNLWIVFLVSGLWHGASWNFVIWGAFHGFFLIMDRLFLEKFLNKAGSVIATIFTFLVVIIGWVFFRLDHFSEARLVIKKMFEFNFSDINIANASEFNVVLICALVFSFFTSFKIGKYIQDKVYYSGIFYNRPIISVVFFLCVFSLCLARITASGFNPFIYFRF